MSDTIEGVENTFCGILAGTQFLDCVYKMTHSNRFNWSPPGPFNRNTYKNWNFIRVRTFHKMKLSNYDQYTLSGQTLLVFKACQPLSSSCILYRAISLCSSSSPLSSSPSSSKWPEQENENDFIYKYRVIMMMKS